VHQQAAPFAGPWLATLGAAAEKPAGTVASRPTDDGHGWMDPTTPVVPAPFVARRPHLTIASENLHHGLDGKLKIASEATLRCLVKNQNHAHSGVYFLSYWRRPQEW
jgi:hypothetical protein